jgi:hypothetical protein
MAKSAAKAKAQNRAKAKAKVRPGKADPPDWLRKAMAVKTPAKPKVGRKPNAVKEKFEATKAKRGRKSMANVSKDKPLPDPTDDPDFRAGTKGDLPSGPDIKPPGILDPKPPSGPVDPGYDKPGGALDPNAPKPGQLPGRRRPLAGAKSERGEIDDDKVANVIADTLGGSGDQHARAEQILRRFEEAGWIITAGEGEPSESIQVILDDTEATRERENAEAEARAAREEEARLAMQGDRPEALRQALEGGGEEKSRDFMEGRHRQDDPKGADAGKGRSKDDPKGADDRKDKK